MRFPTRPWAWLFAALVAAVSLAVPSAAQSGPDFPVGAGTSTGAFGPSIGLDFRAGVLHAAWADTGISGGGDVELAAARVAVAPDGGVSVGPTVNVSNAAGAQSGASLALDPTAAGRVLAVANAFGETPGILRARSVDGGPRGPRPRTRSGKASASARRRSPATASATASSASSTRQIRSTRSSGSR